MSEALFISVVIRTNDVNIILINIHRYIVMGLKSVLVLVVVIFVNIMHCDTCRTYKQFFYIVLTFIDFKNIHLSFIIEVLLYFLTANNLPHHIFN